MGRRSPPRAHASRARQNPPTKNLKRDVSWRNRVAAVRQPSAPVVVYGTAAFQQLLLFSFCQNFPGHPSGQHTLDDKSGGGGGALEVESSVVACLLPVLGGTRLEESWCINELHCEHLRTAGR